MRRRIQWWTRALVVAAIWSAAPAVAQLSGALVRGPYLQSPTPSSIVVRWRTDIPTDSRVRFGAAPDALSGEAADPTLTTEHAVTLTGLDPATRYHYAVGSASGDLAGGPGHTFRTPPVPGSRRPVRIWAFGDSGQGSPEQAAVRDAFRSVTTERGPDVWLLLGDNAYLAGTDDDYQSKFFGYYGDLLRQLPVWSTFGNHENFVAFSATQTGPYYDIFTFPKAGEAGGEPSGTEAYFSFDYANVHFVNLNSQDVSRAPGSDMLTWLEQDLASNTREWTIAFFHHPVYSFGSHNTDTDDGTASPAPPTPLDDNAIQEMRGNVLPILEAGGVDLVLTAHSHSYERSMLLDGHYGTSDTLTEAMKVDFGTGRIGDGGAYRKTAPIFDDAHSGTVYAVVGTGAESFAAGDHPAIVETVDSPGSLIVDVDGGRLHARFIDLQGQVRDEFTILRGASFAPVAVDDFATTAPLTPVTLDLLANDFDPDGDLLIVEAVSAASTGQATDRGDGTVTYTPAGTFAAGSDTFTYVVGDGTGLTASAEVTITIACPQATGVFFDDLEPAAAAGWAVDTALNANPASAVWSVVEEGSAHSPTRAWFSESSVINSDKDDRLIAPPQELTAASRLSFWHRFSFEAEFDGGMLEISTDGGLIWTDLGPWIALGGYNGTILGGSRGAWTGHSAGGPDAMTPVEVDLAAFAGPGRLVRWRLRSDLFTPEASQGWFVDDVRFTDVGVGPGECNLPPRALADAAQTIVDTPVTIDLLANDSDPNGDPITISALGQPAHGTVAHSGGGTVTYTPDGGFAGTDVFAYEISDGELTAGAGVTVRVIQESGAARVRGNGEILDGAMAARFALHVRGEGSGWLRYRGAIEIEGQAAELAVFGDRAEIRGVCWLTDGSPCTFLATCGDLAHPGVEGDRFGIEVLDDAGGPIHAAEGPVIKGHVKID